SVGRDAHHEDNRNYNASDQRRFHSENQGSRRFRSIKRFWADSIQESGDSSGFEPSNRVPPVEQQKTDGGSAEGPAEKRFREYEGGILAEEILYDEPGRTQFVDPASGQHYSEKARGLRRIQEH